MKNLTDDEVIAISGGSAPCQYTCSCCCLTKRVNEKGEHDRYQVAEQIEDSIFTIKSDNIGNAQLLCTKGCDKDKYNEICKNMLGNDWIGVSHGIANWMTGDYMTCAVN